jgi:hypothetical protein
VRREKIARGSAILHGESMKRVITTIVLLMAVDAGADRPVHQIGPLPPPGLPGRTVEELPQRAPTAAELAHLYTTVARELSALEAKKGATAAIDLWPRFRWIRIQDALGSLHKRVESYAILDQLHREIASAR